MDRLASIRELTDSSGVIQAQYAYDSYGQTTKLQGSLSSDFQYAGYYSHFPSELNLAVNSSYSSKFARWINRDPIGEAGGLNLFGYVSNDPVNSRDAQGLQFCPTETNLHLDPLVPITYEDPGPNFYLDPGDSIEGHYFPPILNPFQPPPQNPFTLSPIWGPFTPPGQPLPYFEPLFPVPFLGNLRH